MTERTISWGLAPDERHPQTPAIQLKQRIDSDWGRILQFQGKVTRSGVTVYDADSDDDSLRLEGHRFLGTADISPLRAAMASLDAYIASNHRDAVTALLRDHPDVAVPLFQAIRDIEGYPGVTGIVLEADRDFGGPPIILGVSTDLEFEDIWQTESQFWDDPAHHAIFDLVLFSMDR